MILVYNFEAKIIRYGGGYVIYPSKEYQEKIEVAP